jgi:hypothetical protein
MPGYSSSFQRHWSRNQEKRQLPDAIDRKQRLYYDIASQMSRQLELKRPTMDLFLCFGDSEFASIGRQSEFSILVINTNYGKFIRPEFLCEATKSALRFQQESNCHPHQLAQSLGSNVNISHHVLSYFLVMPASSLNESLHRSTCYSKSR